MPLSKCHCMARKPREVHGFNRVVNIFPLRCVALCSADVFSLLITEASSTCHLCLSCRIFSLEPWAKASCSRMAALGRLLRVCFTAIPLGAARGSIGKLTSFNDTKNTAHVLLGTSCGCFAIPQPAAGWKRKDSQQMMAIDKNASCTPLHTSLVPRLKTAREMEG